MNRYIGLDAHAQSCTFAVLNEGGKVVKTNVVETNGQSLVEFLKLTPGRLHLCMEECTQSQWLFEILSPHVHTLAVVRGEKREGNKNDAIDAVALGERMRTGRLGSPIFKPPPSFTALCDLTRTYRMINGDVIRTKNRIKSFYRARGISSGADVYDSDQRGEISKDLNPAARMAVSLLGEELDKLEEIKVEAGAAMIEEAAKHSATRILITAPGIGPVRAAQLLAVVVSPHRFRTSRQFWAYCGLAIVMRSSADWKQTPSREWVRSNLMMPRGLNRNFNRHCKAVFKDAATTVVARMHSDPLYSDYQRLLDRGTKPNLAKLTIARRIAAITLRMWKNMEVYNPEYRTDQA